MRSKKQIEAYLDELWEEVDKRREFHYTFSESIQDMIEALEWVLEKGQKPIL